MSNAIYDTQHIPCHVIDDLGQVAYYMSCVRYMCFHTYLHTCSYLYTFLPILCTRNLHVFLCIFQWSQLRCFSLGNPHVVHKPFHVLAGSPGKCGQAQYIHNSTTTKHTSTISTTNAATNVVLV
jgi:hypothetical protein